jgi:hypothetical protein
MARSYRGAVLQAALPIGYIEALSQIATAGQHSAGCGWVLQIDLTENGLCWATVCCASWAALA